MKLGVSSYSYWRYLCDGKMDLFQVIKLAAEMGFEGIEFSGFGPNTENENQFDFAKKVKDACAEAKLEVVSWTIGADFLNPPAGGTVEDEIKRLQGEVDIAVALGAPKMRHDATGGFPGRKNDLTDYMEALPIVAKGYRGVTEYAADKGVKTMIENHGYFFQDSYRVEALIKKVDHPNFGILVDVGNFMCADEDPNIAVKQVAPYAFHAHVKDFHKKCGCDDPGDGWFRSRGGSYLRGAIVGHGDAKVRVSLKHLKDAGYNGFVSIEFEGMEDNKLALEIGLANLKRYIANL